MYLLFCDDAVSRGRVCLGLFETFEALRDRVCISFFDIPSHKLYYVELPDCTPTYWICCANGFRRRVSTELRDPSASRPVLTVMDARAQ